MFQIQNQVQKFVFEKVQNLFAKMDRTKLTKSKILKIIGLMK